MLKKRLHNNISDNLAPPFTFPEQKKKKVKAPLQGKREKFNDYDIL